MIKYFPVQNEDGACGFIACVRVERRVRGQKSAVVGRQTKGKK